MKNLENLKNVKIYRVDEFNDNMGNVIGFFASKEEAESKLEFSSPTNTGDGTFSQITEFEIPESKLEGVELSDTERMLDEGVWGSGEIINDYYYI